MGSCLLIGIEWANLFVLRALAQTSPEALAPLDASPLLNTGWASGAGLFALGWLAMAANTWRVNRLPRWASSAVIVGFFAIPLLTISPLGIAGAIAGNAILGAGLIGLGRALATSER